MAFRISVIICMASWKGFVVVVVVVFEGPFLSASVSVKNAVGLRFRLPGHASDSNPEFQTTRSSSFGNLNCKG